MVKKEKKDEEEPVTRKMINREFSDASGTPPALSSNFVPKSESARHESPPLECKADALTS